MGTKNNLKKCRIIQARYAAALYKNCAVFIASPPFTRRSTRESRCANLVGSNKGYAEGSKRPGHHQSPLSIPKSEGLNLIMSNIKSFRAIRNAL